MQATEATYELAGVQAATQSRRKHRIFSFLALMLIAFSVHTFHISRPFLPNNESTATAIPVMHAVNFARYGPAASRFAGILNTGQVEPTNWVVYAHHPPGRSNSHLVPTSPSAPSPGCFAATPLSAGTKHCYIPSRQTWDSSFYSVIHGAHLPASAAPVRRVRSLLGRILL